MEPDHSLPLEISLEIEKHKRMVEKASKEQVCQLYIDLFTFHLRFRENVKGMMRQGNL